ncbi:MFS transporter [Rubrobacter tropicus]|uniref:MFS transporter n=1 Tax=Rubrobacter tropicus TaxID=2653851 RepID=A0A6G8QCH3_9ACTN|nr:MFS transporter [Rubrobacter tropicus]QIN83967.1 MFS transporter [Rubrobacter tropicus]
MREEPKANERMQGGFVRDPITWTTYGLVGYFAFTETVLGPIMPFLREEQDLGYAAAGLHFSAFALGGLLVGVLGDRLLQRWGRWTGLWGGAAGIALGTLLLVLSPGAWATVPATFVMGLCGALLLVASEALLSDRHGEWSAVALSESNVAASACAISAPLLVGAFAAAGLGWRAALGAPVVALILLAALSFSRSRARPERATVVEKGAASGAGSRTLSSRYWAFWALVSLGVASEWCVGYWGADFLDDSAGLTRPGAAAALTLFLVAMLVGRLLGSRLARAVPPTTLLVATLCVALVGFPVFWLSGGTTPALAGLFITGLGIGSIYPLGVSAALAAAPGNADAAAARLSLGGGGAVFLAPFALGALADRVGIGPAFAIVAPMLLAAVALAIIAGRTRPAET